MKEYILKIVGVSLLAAISEHMAEEKWRRFVNLVSGFMILAVLLSPFISKWDTKLFDEFSLDTHQADLGTDILYENIKKELETKISSDIKRRVAEEFSKDVSANVLVLCNKEGKIERVKRISLKGREDKKITERLKFIYGADEVIWVE